MDRKTRIILIALAAAAVALFASKAILGSVLAPEKTIGKFLDSIHAQDADDFRKVTTVYMDEFELTDEKLAPFFERYSGDLEALSSFRNVLTQDLTDMRSGAMATGNGVFRLVEKQSNFLFTSYAVEVTPITAYTYCEFDGAELSLMGETYEVTGGETTLRLLPGVYSGTATYTSPDTGVTLESTIDGYLLDSYNDSLDIAFEYTSMWLESYNSNLELKEVKINGKSYTGDLSEYNFYNGFYIYPVDPDSTVVVTASAQGVDFEQTFSLAESTNCRFNNYQLPDELAEEVKAIGADVMRKWTEIVMHYSADAAAGLAEAYGTTSPSYVDDVTSYINRQTSSANDYTICRYFQSEPAVTEPELSVDVNSSGISVTVRQDITGTIQRAYYASGEAYGEPYEETFSCSAQVRYADGTWMVVNSAA